MKKLFVLLLVLGVARAASADIPLVFTVNGQSDISEITLGPSEAVGLGIELLAGHSFTGCIIEYILSNASAEFICSGYVDIHGTVFEAIHFPAPFELPGNVDWFNPQDVGISINYWDFLGEFGHPIMGPQVIMENMVLHCLGTTDVLLQVINWETIVDGEEIPGGTVLHTLLIHQVPEPMTLTLFALGGLFLSRRKK